MTECCVLLHFQCKIFTIKRKVNENLLAISLKSLNISTKSKVFSPTMEISVLHNRKKRTDPEMRKLESDIRETVSCRENFNEYLNYSSLHGLRYVGDRTISLLERYVSEISE